MKDTKKNSGINVQKRRLRKGYTTGSCAAAAAKAAVLMLLGKQPVNTVKIDTPAGVKLTLDVKDITIKQHKTSCCIIKDAGDDSDVTDGLGIYAIAEFDRDSTCVEIKASEGIGIVTKPGLKVELGKPAINPVPLKMITQEVQSVLPRNTGISVTIHVPGGKEIAEKTFNPKLGIKGGISILGTTGIEVPMSEEAWMETTALEISQKAALGIKDIVFVFGSIGEKFCTDILGIDKKCIIRISNFVGHAFMSAADKNFKNIIFCGHIGKIVKVSAGIFNTHSSKADARKEILCAYAGLCGAEIQCLKQVYSCTTTTAAVEIINNYNIKGVYSMIAENAAKRCSEKIQNVSKKFSRKLENFEVSSCEKTKTLSEKAVDQVQVHTVVFGDNNCILAQSVNALEAIKKVKVKK